MNKEEEDNLFKIEEKLIIKILEFAKKEYRFFFGFFLGVMVVLLLN